MGSLTYDDGITIQSADRTLMHLVRELRKGESPVSWRDRVSIEDGEGSSWINPALALYFNVGPKVPAISLDWLLALGRCADPATGLIVSNENGELFESSRKALSGVVGRRPRREGLTRENRRGARHDRSHNGRAREEPR